METTGELVTWIGVTLLCNQTERKLWRDPRISLPLTRRMAANELDLPLNVFYQSLARNMAGASSFFTSYICVTSQISKLWESNCVSFYCHTSDLELDYSKVRPTELGSSSGAEFTGMGSEAASTGCGSTELEFSEPESSEYESTEYESTELETVVSGRVVDVALLQGSGGHGR